MSDRTDPGRRAFLATAGAGLASLAGCLGNPFEPGGTEQESDGSTEQETDGESATGSGDADATGDTQDDSADDSNDGTGGDADSTDDAPPEPDLVVDVAKENFQFTPEQFEIDVGGTVKWIWRDGGHNVRPDSIPDGSDWSGTEGGDGTTYPEGHELVSTFETPGQYDYYCAPHRSLGLRGSFTVREE